MNDSISTIGLGVDTASALTELRALRAEFAGLKKDVNDLNTLRASADGVVSGTGAASNKLATLSAELKAAKAQIAEFEASMQAANRNQAASAQASAQAVIVASGNKLRAVVEDEKQAAAELAKYEKQKTATVVEEAKKRETANRYTMGQSAKVGNISYSMRGASDEAAVNSALAQAERTRREILANSQAMTMANIDRADQQRLERSRTAQAMLIAEVERAEALRREKVANSQAMTMANIDRADQQRIERSRTAQAMLIAEVERAEGLRREKVATSNAMLMAEIDRAEALRLERTMVAQAMLIAEVERGEALRREKLATSQAMTIAEIDRAEALAREKRATAQAMQIADIERAEALAREKRATAQAMQIAEIDRADAIKREKNAVAQAQLIAEIDRAEAQKIEVIRNTRAMQMAEIDRADAQRRERNATAQAMLIADIERAEAKQREIRENAHIMLMATIDRQDAERRQKQATANEMLIADVDRAEARKQAILNNNFATGSLRSQTTTVGRAKGLVDAGDSRLATELYGSAAVGAVGNYEKMLAQLNATQVRGNGVKEEATKRLQINRDAMNDAHSAARGLAGGLGQLWMTWGSVVPLVAGAAVTGSMAKVYTVGKDIEYQLQFLRALASEVEREPIDVGAFLKITDGTMASVKEAAEGMRALSQAGMNQKEALRALPDVLDLAAIGEMKVGQAAITATGVVHAFNLELSDISRVGDIFAKIASSSNTSVVAMTESMKQASTVGEMFKLSIEEASASIGVLAQRNIIGTSAGTALTTALKNIYEPTAKAKAALDSLNISTDDGHGGLKNYTKMIEELRAKVTSLNESDQAVFLGTITDQRGAKALSALIKNFAEYKQFLDDASESTGFMSRATLELEDTVQGAAQRMSNAMDGTFEGAFKKAEPVIRSTLRSMTEMAGNDSLQNMIARLTITAARLTQTFVENAKWIGIAAGAYVGLRVVATLSNAYVAWRTNVATTTLTVAANTAAVGANTTALTIQQQAQIAAGRSALVMAAGTRALSAAMGPISLAIMAAATAYQWFSSKVDESEQALARSQNRADTVLDYYNRQIEKLRELNKELREKAELEKGGGKEIQGIVRGDLVTAVANAQNKADTAKSEYETYKKDVGDDPTAWQAARLGMLSNKLKAAEEALKSAKSRLDNLEQAPGDLVDLQQENKQYRDKASVKSRIEQMIDDAGGGLYGGGTAKSREIVPELRKLLDRVVADGTSYKEVALELKGYQDRINASKDKLPGLGNKNDLYRAAQTRKDGELQAIRDNEKSGLADNKTALESNRISDYQAIQTKYDITKKAREDELRVFKEKEDLAAKAEKRQADQAAINNKIAETRRAIEEADRVRARERQELEAGWAKDSLKTQVDLYQKRGELVRAFDAEFMAKNGGEMKRIKSGLDDELTPAADREKLQGRSIQLANERSSGSASARFQELRDEFEATVNGMQEGIADVAQKASESNGFLSDMGAAQAAEDIRQQAIPAAQELLEQMGQIAESLGDSKLKGDISKLSTNLIKEANRTKKEWIDAGKSIEKSLSDAFGKGGKAVGALVSALVKQKAEQKDINDQLKRAEKEKDPVKATEIEMAARKRATDLQVSSYGEIAGAAKGFFDEQSKGYQALEAAEKAFRAVEIAMALSNHLVKAGFIEADLMTHLFGIQVKQAADTADTAKVVAEEGVKQQVKGVTAVANQASGGDAYSAWARMALMVASLAAIGIMVGGAGGGGTKMDVAKERQKYQGTGFQYDPSNGGKNNPYEWELQKSDSLNKALDALKDNSTIELRYSSSQLMALESIKAGISGMAASISTATGLRGTRADERSLGVYDTHSKLGFSSSSTSLQDSGIVFYNTNLGYVMGGGGLGESYAQMQHKSKSFWGLSSSTNNYTVKDTLDPTLSRQMGLVVQDMFKTISDSAVQMGKDKGQVDSRLSGMSLQQAGLNYVSLKGLSQEDAQKELEAIFSNMGDQMARAVMPGLEAFEKAGEGYYGTVVRVSSAIESANYTMQKLGIAAADFNTIGNKTGDVAAEIVRTSLLNKEYQSGYNTGIARMMATMSGSANEMAEAYTKLNDVRRTMKAVGSRGNVDVTDDMVKGAGGLDNLSSGMEAYLEGFFDESERSAVKASMLNDEFVKLGLTLPDSTKQFRNLVMGIDRSTAAGQTMYGTLIGLAEEFSDLADDMGTVNPLITKQRTETDKLIEKTEEWLDTLTNARALLNELDVALSDDGIVDQSKRIAELRDLMSSKTLGFDQQLEIAGELKDLVLEKYQVEKENAENLIEFGREMQSYVLSLKVGDKSPLTNKQKLEEAERQYQQTLSDSQSTDKDTRDQARGELQGKADTLLELARTYYTSSQTYTDIFNRVTGQLDSLGGSSLNQGTLLERTAQDQLKEVVDLRALVQQIYNEAQDGYDKSAKALNEHLAVLQGMYNSINLLTEMPKLLRDLPAELAAKMVMGQNVDTSGSTGSGVVMPPPVVGYYNPKPVVMGSHANGLDYVPFDGYVAELHRGERVLTANEVSRMDKASMSTQSFTPAERDEMAKEIRELKEVVNTLVTAQDVNTVRMIQAMFASSKQNAEEVVEGTKTTAPREKVKAV